MSLGSDPTTFGTNMFTLNGDDIVDTVAGSLVHTDIAQRLLIAPSCYSEPRKVVFWAAFRHEQTGGAGNIPCRLRVAPSSTSTTVRTLDSILLPESTFNITIGPGALWAQSDIDSEDVFYSAQSARQNSVTSLQFPILDSPGAQVVYQEFDLFEAGDQDFWTDFNSVAAAGNDNRHIGYTVAIERTDNGTWVATPTSNVNKSPVIVSCGFAVIQAPAVVNNTRLYIPATNGIGPGAMLSASFGATRAIPPLFFHADEWDADTMEIRYVSSFLATAGSPGGWRARVIEVVNQSTSATQVYLEDFVRAALAGLRSGICRTADVLPSLTDGGIYQVQHQANTGVSQPLPWGWWEITLKNHRKISTFFNCSHQCLDASRMPGTPPVGGTPTWSKSETLFDPLWFEDFESNRILSARVQGGLSHDVAGNDTSQQVNLNANLEDNVATSLFNVVVQPEISSTPNATIGLKAVDSEITSNNPINLAGKRKLTQRFAGTVWTTGTDDIPGGMGIMFVLDVPNTDIPPIGPIFDLGAFSPEGCAATSAGLGEPSALVITNGSAIPKKFNPTAAGTAGEIEDAGIPTPFEGEVPVAIPEDAGVSPDNGLGLGIYKYRYTFRNCCTDRESDPNPEDIVVDTTGQSPAAKVTFSFAGIRIPGDPQICEICLYRTVEGGDFPIMAKVGCFDPDDASALFVDDVSDSALDFTNEGLSILNAPMPCVPIVVDFRNRLFGMGDIPNLSPAGTVSVVNGSDIVTGDGDVQWDRCLEGKFIQVGSDCRSYEILRILPPEEGTSPPVGRLQLVDEYEGATDTGLTYHICGRPNRVYFSEPLEPEYWPAINFLDVEPGDGDRLMGAVSNFDRLVICKRRKTYVLTFRENPGVEVIVPSRISSDIGCIGPRTFAQIESGSVWLADRGLALYDGRTVMHVPESENMNDIFTDPDNPNYVRRDPNGRVIDAVGVFYPTREQYLLLLPTVQTDRGCNMMLVWDVKLKNITLLRFCQQFQSMVVAKDTDGNERVYLGDVNGFVWIYDIGDTDGAGFPNATGTVRGDVTDAGIDVDTGANYLESDGANFIVGGIPSFAGLSGLTGLSGSFDNSNMGLAGACVYTRRKNVDYDEPWVQRTIYAATAERLFVTPEWGPDVPFDSTGEFEYEFMIGPIEVDWIFKPQNFGTDDTAKRNWKQYVIHEVESFASQLRVDLLPDFSSVDPEADSVVDPITEETGGGRIFRMDFSKGRQVKPVGRLIYQHMAVRMRNFAPEEPIRIINHVLGAQPQAGK